MPPSFLSELSKPQPVPGGGAASAQAALTALALLSKIVSLEQGRPGQPGKRTAEWDEAATSLRICRRELMGLRRRDDRAYLDWLAHRGSIREAEHTQALVEIPLRIQAVALRVLELVQRVSLNARRHLWADLLVVSELLRGAGNGAAHIASSNLRLIGRVPLKESLAGELAGQSRQGGRIVRRIRRELSGKVDLRK